MNSFKARNVMSRVSIEIISINNEASKGKKFALTQGVLAAKNEYLLFTDADCIPASKNWIRIITSTFSAKTSLILGYGAYSRIQGSFLNKLIRFETLMTAVQYFSYARAGKAYMGVGRNIAYTKEIFLRAGGFASHRHIRSGDDDLFVNQVSTALNTEICDDPLSFTYSKPETSLTKWLHQKRRHITTSSHYRVYHKFFLGVFYLSQIAFYLLTIVAFVFQEQVNIILGLFLFRFLFWYIILIKSSNKLNEKDLIGFGPLYEISLIFIQLYIFLKNIVSSPKNW
jgi:glycosyltransferase involved in cell wall biosynthesis